MQIGKLQNLEVTVYYVQLNSQRLETQFQNTSTFFCLFIYNKHLLFVFIYRFILVKELINTVQYI